MFQTLARRSGRSNCAHGGVSVGIRTAGRRVGQVGSGRVDDELVGERRASEQQWIVEAAAIHQIRFDRARHAADTDLQTDHGPALDRTKVPADGHIAQDRPFEDHGARRAGADFELYPVDAIAAEVPGVRRMQRGRVGAGIELGLQRHPLRTEEYGLDPARCLRGIRAGCDQQGGKRRRKPVPPRRWP